MKELRILTQECGVERLQFGHRLKRVRFGPRADRARYRSELETNIGCSTGQPENHPVQHQEHWNLEQHGQTTAHWVDVVLLIEHHQLFVHSLPLVLAIFALNSFELRLKDLEAQHRARALNREWRRNDEHHQGQQNNG